LLYSPESAKLTREHNNANVAVLGARSFSNKENLDFLKVFLTTPFSNIAFNGNVICIKIFL
jgi:ribose 5-phosphate isomerase B